MLLKVRGNVKWALISLALPVTLKLERSPIWRWNYGYLVFGLRVRGNVEYAISISEEWHKAMMRESLRLNVRSNMKCALFQSNGVHCTVQELSTPGFIMRRKSSGSVIFISQFLPSRHPSVTTVTWERSRVTAVSMQNIRVSAYPQPHLPTSLSLDMFMIVQLYLG